MPTLNSNSAARRIATSYQHVQDTPSDVWTINHNLKDYPIVDVYTLFEGSLQRILPTSVTYVSHDTCTLTFSSPRTGYATVV